MEQSRSSSFFLTGIKKTPSDKVASLWGKIRQRREIKEQQKIVFKRKEKIKLPETKGISAPSLCQCRNERIHIWFAQKYVLSDQPSQNSDLVLLVSLSQESYQIKNKEIEKKKKRSESCIQGQALFLTPHTE